MNIHRRGNAVMVTENEFAGLVEGLYDAALDGTRWNDALGMFANALDASKVFFFVADTDRDRTGFAHLFNVPEEQREAYGARFVGCDAWLRHARRIRVSAGEAHLSHEFFPDEALVRTEFYNDFLRPMDSHYGCGGTIRYDGPEMSVVFAHRSLRQGPFGELELAYCQRLMPHFARAVQIHRRLFDLKDARATATAALDSLGTGVVLLDGGGQVVFMNRRAVRIVEANDGLGVNRAGFCQAGRDAETTALRKLVHAVLRTGTGQDSAGGAISLPRPSGRRPLAVLVAPLGRHMPDIGAARPAAILFVADPEDRPEIPVDLCARLYGLTPGEARLAVGLMEGASLADIAARLGIARGTARVVLGRVFQKTGTHRQGELVARLWADLAVPVSRAN